MIWYDTEKMCNLLCHIASEYGAILTKLTILFREKNNSQSIPNFVM